MRTQEQIAQEILAKVRPIAPGGKLLQGDVHLIYGLAAALAAREKGQTAPPAVPIPGGLQTAPTGRAGLSRAGDPLHLTIGFDLLGTREIPGPQHNPKILSLWQRLRVSWFNDETTPWCGAFVGYCLAEAGRPVPAPGIVGRALAWAEYGKAVKPQRGAIGVKRRAGGGHVFFIIGETPDRRYFKALGGNQSDAVSIVDILKTDVIAVRYPPDVGEPGLGLPIMPAGTVSRREA